MKNLVQASPTNDGTKHLEFAAPAALSSGDFAVIGDLPCVAVTDLGSGERGTFLVEQVIRYAKASVSFSEGQAVYFDSGANEMTDVVGGGNDIVGHALSDEANDVVFKMASVKA